MITFTATKTEDEISFGFYNNNTLKLLIYTTKSHSGGAAFVSGQVVIEVKDKNAVRRVSFGERRAVKLSYLTSQQPVFTFQPSTSFLECNFRILSEFAIEKEHTQKKKN